MISSDLHTFTAYADIPKAIETSSDLHFFAAYADITKTFLISSAAYADIHRWHGANRLRCETTCTGSISFEYLNKTLNLLLGRVRQGRGSGINEAVGHKQYHR